MLIELIFALHFVIDLTHTMKSPPSYCDLLPRYRRLFRIHDLPKQIYFLIDIWRCTRKRVIRKSDCTKKVRESWKLCLFTYGNKIWFLLNFQICNLAIRIFITILLIPFSRHLLWFDYTKIGSISLFSYNLSVTTYVTPLNSWLDVNFFKTRQLYWLYSDTDVTKRLSFYATFDVIGEFRDIAEKVFLTYNKIILIRCD